MLRQTRELQRRAVEAGAVPVLKDSAGASPAVQELSALLILRGLGLGVPYLSPQLSSARPAQSSCYHPADGAANRADGRWTGLA